MSSNWTQSLQQEVILWTSKLQASITDSRGSQIWCMSIWTTIGKIYLKTTNSATTTGLKIKDRVISQVMELIMGHRALRMTLCRSFSMSEEWTGQEALWISLKSHTSPITSLRRHLTWSVDTIQKFYIKTLMNSIRIKPTIQINSTYQRFHNTFTLVKLLPITWEVLHLTTRSTEMQFSTQNSKSSKSWGRNRK
jgi:hypothetical protein